MSSSATSRTEDDSNTFERWPIVYNPKYNVKFCGLEKFHPFDASKWRNTIEHLKKNTLITDKSIHISNEVQESDLLKIHSKRYLQTLKWSFNVAAIAEIPIIAVIPNVLVQKWYLRAMRFQVGGSVLAAKLAIEKGWAINVGGGFHHCSRNKGGGFCPYADITLLLHQLFQDSSVQSAMIVDLDAHQGNGHERDFCEDDRVFIFDAYNSGIYPHDNEAKKAINCRIELEHFTEDRDYLYLIEKYLEKSLAKFHPDIIVYNAGTDVLEGDPLGKLAVTAEGIINRDKIVFMKARERRIPIVMLTSGGYLKCTAKIIADSILNLAALGLIGPYNVDD